MSAHALLSASSAHRWLSCPPSARLCEDLQDKPSGFAKEGTEAHALCEFKLRRALGMEARDPVGELEYYGEEMEGHAEAYKGYVMEVVTQARLTCRDSLVLVEQRVDFSRYVPQGFGTADCVVVADGKLTIIDFKYGAGVLVSADHNPQMQLYALGAMELLDGIYDFDTVSMTIFQPRRENVSTFTMAKAELVKWAEEVLKPAATQAFEGEGKFAAGDHCRFCLAKATCRERAAYYQSLAVYDFEAPALLEDEEVSDVLGKLDGLTAWAADVKEYALQAALRGKTWPGFKVVEGRSSRRFTDEEAVAEAVKGRGLDPYERKLLGITAMTALLGKKVFNELLGGLVEKPMGRPTLVPESDKREALPSAESEFRKES